MIRRLWDLTAFESTAVLRRRWFVALVLVGLATVPLAAAVASSEAGLRQVDAYRSAAASLLLVGGLIVALALGSTTIARGGESGHLGLLVASGGSRAEVTVARLAARIAALALCLVLWGLALQAGSAALGLGLDGPLAVHVAASGETLAVVLLACAAVSTVLGPWVAAVVGLAVHVTAQAVVNLEAAADLGLLGAWTRLVHVMYNLLPRAVYSPMIVEMQNRGEGGPAAPRFEINKLDQQQVPVPLEAASTPTVLWTLFWCLLLGWLCVQGMRRRAL